MPMQPFVALAALILATAAQAQGNLPAAQQIADASPARPSAAPPKPVQRQLSAEQRAELRRQLYQFSRSNGRGH